MIKRLLFLLGLAVGALGLQLGALQPKALPDITLTEVQVIGTRYEYCDGTEISKKEYDDLSKPNAPPVKCLIIATHKFNTIDGKIHDGEYYIENGETRVKIKEIDYPIAVDNTSGAAIVGNKLKITDLEKLKEDAK